MRLSFVLIIALFSMVSPSDLRAETDPSIQRLVESYCAQPCPKKDVGGSSGPSRLRVFEGLVPHLITAAGDEDWCNRRLALYALADTGAQEAAAEIRRRLKDPVSSVSRDRALERCFA